MSCSKMIALIKWKASATATTTIAFTLKINKQMNKQNDKMKCSHTLAKCELIVIM